MALKDYYEEIKRKKPSTLTKIDAIIYSLGFFAFYIFIIYLGWTNIISKVFNMPDITYFQTMGLVVWVYLLKILFEFSTTRKLQNEKNR